MNNNNNNTNKYAGEAEVGLLWKARHEHIECPAQSYLTATSPATRQPMEWYDDGATYLENSLAGTQLQARCEQNTNGKSCIRWEDEHRLGGGTGYVGKHRGNKHSGKHNGKLCT